MISFKTAIATAVTSLSFTVAVELDINNPDSIRSTASTLAFGLQSWYHTNISGVPASAIGTLDPPLYWWEAGAVWGAMVDYWAYTNDTSYNAVASQALLAQVGPDWNYMPPAYFTSLGNDDQAFWALAVLSAEEYGFPFPAGQRVTRWIDLAIAVWNTQVARWNTEACNGGLKWQIFESNKGYNYRNSISNGAFIQISARLARYTGNQTCEHMIDVEWAGKTWSWMSAIGLISPDYRVFDGSDDTKNCSELDHTQWSYNPAMLLYGTAMLANYTNAQVWKDRTEGLLTSIENTFFSPFDNATDIMFEAACEPYNTCNNDQFSFKAYLARWMAKSAVVYPSITDTVRKRLQISAIAASKSCTGGDNNRTCGQKWYVGGHDGNFGVGQELSALETVQSLLLLKEGWAAERIPKTGPNVNIQVVPVTSTFPLTPATPSATSNPRASSSAAAAGTRTNFGGRTATAASWETWSSGDGGLRAFVVAATPMVVAAVVALVGA